MSGGSWLNHGTDAIGTTPGYMGAWEKLQLGWLSYRTVPYGTDATVYLGPAGRASQTSQQAALVTLPDKTVKTDDNTPRGGSYEWWGGSADNLQNTLTRSVDLTGKTSASLSAWIQYDIEPSYDYLDLQPSTDGSTWTQVGTPIDGTSDGQWVQKTWDLASLAGKSGLLRFRYATDGGRPLRGPLPGRPGDHR